MRETRRASPGSLCIHALENKYFFQWGVFLAESKIFLHDNGDDILRHVREKCPRVFERITFLKYSYGRFQEARSSRCAN